MAIHLTDRLQPFPDWVWRASRHDHDGRAFDLDDHAPNTIFGAVLIVCKGVPEQFGTPSGPGPAPLTERPIPALMGAESSVAAVQ